MGSRAILWFACEGYVGLGHQKSCPEQNEGSTQDTGRRAPPTSRSPCGGKWRRSLPAHRFYPLQAWPPSAPQVPSEGRLERDFELLRLQWSNGMQIGICSHKDALCMDFLLVHLETHHPSPGGAGLYLGPVSAVSYHLVSEAKVISLLGSLGTPKLWKVALSG